MDNQPTPSASIRTNVRSSKTVDNAGSGEDDPLMRLVKALAVRQAILDASPPTAANLNDQPTTKERKR